MPTLTVVFDRAATVAWELRRNELYRKFTTALRAYNRGTKTSDKLKDLENARTEFDAVLRQRDPGAIFKALAEAHTALKDTVHNPQVTSATLFAAIQRVSEEAVKLAAISKELRGAKEKKAAT